MLSTKQINAIGNILDFGGTSQGDGESAIATSFQGDTLTLKYSTIVHFASEVSLRDQLVLLVDESMQRLTNKVSGLKSKFKEITGDTLKLSETSNKDNVELIQATSNSPRKIAYYRRFVSLRIDM